MAVKIRLMRMGKKKQPTYRVVVADSRSPRDGRIIESIGRYDPRQEPSVIEVDNDRAVHWLGVGAKPTERVQKLLEITGAWARFKIARGEVYTVPTRDEPKVAEEPQAPLDESAATDEPQAAPEETAATDAPEAKAETPMEAPAADEASDDAGDAGSKEE